MPTWYLGPAGALQTIPAPARDLDVSPKLVGAVLQGLDGSPTVHRLAQPRTWPCQWVALTEDQSTYLQMVGLGLVREPLRLIDPEQRNRLPRRVASGGAYHQSAEDFSQTGGSTPTYVSITDPPATVPVRGVISWQRTTTAAGVLTTTNSYDRVPLIPGEQVRVSVWARGAAIAVSAGYDAWNAAGSASRANGSTSTLHATNWTQVSVTYTPPSDRIELSPLLNVASGQSASTLQVTGWQVAPATAPTTWTVGGGAPVVVAGSELTDTYPLTGLRGMGLVLLERYP